MRLGRERLLGPGAQDTRRCSRRRYRRGCLQECSGCDEPAFAVYGVPDAKKGERLMVLTTLRNEQLPEVLRHLGARGLPALFVPRREQFVTVDALPLLGTGKLDLRAVKERCLAAAAAMGVGAAAGDDEPAA